MNMEEYLRVKDMKYLEYCDYLQEKYGIGLVDYMSPSFQKNRGVSRTKDGLIAHHKMEDRAQRLSDILYAKQYPYEYQKKENIVYCDYLEHLLLHVMIYNETKKFGACGICEFMAPELNDLYSGWQTRQEWRQKCHAKVKNDKNVYLMILKQFIDCNGDDPDIQKMLCSGFSENTDSWDAENNETIYQEIKALFT